ncbi:MAG: 2Fe-2S iron-sulfur cluster binding domain-containing protein, partial [Rhodobacteraceae bacterium]|nr:2Fe-2S iron-sulfur cluster binding domain-containing protein [Paracoccaceae bacterium]
MPKIIFTSASGSVTEVNASSGLSVMEAARNANIDGILAECGGACSCSTCHVYVDADWLAKLDTPDEMETDLLDFAWEPDSECSRLACQIIVTDALDGLHVTVPAQ